MHKILPSKDKKCYNPCVNQVVDFIKKSRIELKRVQWPTKNEALRLTGYVIGVSLGVGLFVMVFDYIFKELLTLILAS